MPQTKEERARPSSRPEAAVNGHSRKDPSPHVAGPTTREDDGDAMDVSLEDEEKIQLDHKDANADQGPGESANSQKSLGSAATGAVPAAIAGQPKIVQTAFIHKLYNMLEDQSIQHLITWSESGESFLISPKAEISKVLATYFKHTNVSSFVRQLNMYGFHKVSDVFHNGTNETPLWEFKHGNNSFRRGDLAGLRDIKRRASKHTLIHRDSLFAGASPSAPPPLPPAEAPQDPVEARLTSLEHNLMDVRTRLSHAEHASAYWNSKCHILAQSLEHCYEHVQSLSAAFMAVLPNPDQAYKVTRMQAEIAQQLESLHALNRSHEVPPYMGHQPVSPRGTPQGEGRRGSHPYVARSGYFRPMAPRSATNSPGHHAASKGGGGFPAPYRGGHVGLPLPPPGPPSPSHRQPSLTPFSDQSGSYQRRHTSADIRNPNWQTTEQLPPRSNPRSAFASGHNSAQWPSSPQPAPAADVEGQRLRDSFASYSFSGNNDLRLPPSSYQAQAQPTQDRDSRPSSPPAPHERSAGAPPTYYSDGSGWGGGGPRLAFRDVFNNSGPPTRRSSVAQLLNPVDTAEQEGEDDIGPDDPRGKRKRVT